MLLICIVQVSDRDFGSYRMLIRYSRFPGLKYSISFTISRLPGMMSSVRHVMLHLRLSHFCFSVVRVVRQ